MTLLIPNGWLLEPVKHDGHVQFQYRNAFRPEESTRLRPTEPPLHALPEWRVHSEHIDVREAADPESKEVTVLWVVDTVF